MVLDFKKDEGFEIASEQFKNIYDPLYSSKKDGVGLGLSTVYQTVNENSFLKFFLIPSGLMMVFLYQDAQPVFKKTLLLLNTPQEVL